MAEEKEVTKSEIAKREEEILKFWQDNQIFEKTLAKDSPKGSFTFYDGPPFATGTPHYGHLTAGTIKDVIPRYKTMQGYYVRRRWGWDCHGLPVENLIEKELGLKTKKDIEEYGIENFNAKARASVLRYADDWRRIVPRLGRFVDMDDDYRTMDPSYSETVWWIFKNLFDQDLIYEGYKAMHLCPRCETTLSNFEVTQGYKDITDLSVYVKFKLDLGQKIGNFITNENTYILAWTTTPWTLPGNVALAVEENIEYTVQEVLDNSSPLGAKKGDFLIFANNPSIFQRIFKDYIPKGQIGAIKENEIRLTVASNPITGKDLIGKKYKPVFDYYLNDSKIENKDRGWQIYPADFVTTESGTGIVHIAPAFGEVDMALGLKEKLPFIQHVAMSGEFKPEVKDFAGQKVKPIENPQAADIEIIKFLAGKGTLFAKEKITHSYPHCWRCDTPLLNYAASSWFVKVVNFKDELIASNQATSWVPENIKDGRFGNWLEGARDWAISRTRYWGAPLPVWKCHKCDKREVIGSLDDIRSRVKKSGNKYFVMRHGQAINNTEGRINCVDRDSDGLTEAGQKEVLANTDKLAKEKIDLIFASDFRRTKETAALLKEKLGLTDEQLIFDKRLYEINVGVYQGKTWDQFNKENTSNDKIYRQYENGETGEAVKRRVMEFLYEQEEKYQNKNILIISHGFPIRMMVAGSEAKTARELSKMADWGEPLTNGECRELPFAPLPSNKDFDLDVHRPFIDNVVFPCVCGGEMKRIPDVFDCWFESGSMPYAQDHYPFNKDHFDPEQKKGWPADFIAEGLDQTRGWFYSLIVLGTALFNESPFKNVVVNGMVLAENGQKMSKSLHNYPEISLVADRYGADALRFYMMSLPVVRAEDLNFSEKGVAEVQRKIVMRLLNVCSFYETYVEARNKNLSVKPEEVTNVLDKWILVRLGEMIISVSDSLDRYELDRALRPIDEFIEDLSTWYLRRSRDRFKSDDENDRVQVSTVTRLVLSEVAKVLAPITPFLAEDLWQKVRGEKDEISVHLLAWPVIDEAWAFNSPEVIDEMAEARKIVSLGLEFRQGMGLKVRQPLSEIIVKSMRLADKLEYQEIIKDELNIKKITFKEDFGEEIWLDNEITDDLKKEGMVREFIRKLQEQRKKMGLVPSDVVSLSIETEEDGRLILRKFEKEIKKIATVKNIEYAISGAVLPELKVLAENIEIAVDEILFKVNFYLASEKNGVSDL